MVNNVPHSMHEEYSQMLKEYYLDITRGNGRPFEALSEADRRRLSNSDGFISRVAREHKVGILVDLFRNRDNPHRIIEEALNTFSNFQKQQI